MGDTAGSTAEDRAAGPVDRWRLDARPRAAAPLPLAAAAADDDDDDDDDDDAPPKSLGDAADEAPPTAPARDAVTRAGARRREVERLPLEAVA